MQTAKAMHTLILFHMPIHANTLASITAIHMLINLINTIRVIGSTSFLAAIHSAAIHAIIIHALAKIWAATNATPVMDMLSLDQGHT